MRDEQYGPSQLIDLSTISLRELEKLESAALRTAAMSCLTDDKEQVAAFSNSL